MDRSYGRPAVITERASSGVSDGPPAAQTGNGKNGGTAPGGAGRALGEVFGFEGFRPGQEAAIEALLDGRHALTVMPTGSGKSLCFQIPALVMDGLTVVVSPLIALMQDQVSVLRLAGVAADCINSANDRGAKVAAWRRAAEGRTRLLYMLLIALRPFQRPTPPPKVSSRRRRTLAKHAYSHRNSRQFPVGCRDRSVLD